MIVGGIFFGAVSFAFNFMMERMAIRSKIRSTYRRSLRRFRGICAACLSTKELCYVKTIHPIEPSHLILPRMAEVSRK